MKGDEVVSRALDAAERLVAHNVAELEQSLGEDDAGRAYREAFQEEAHAAPRAPLDRAALTARLAGERLVLAGAFHSCREAGLGLGRLLEDLAADGAPRAVMLPVVRHEDHAALRKVFDAGELTPEEVVEHLEDLETWPFDVDVYEPLLEAAARHGVALLGHGAPGGEAPMDRAHADAAVLAAELAAHPNRRILAVVGDHHLATPHLPAALAALGVEVPPGARLAQTAWPAWFACLRGGPAPAAAELESEMLALFAASPTRLFESFSNWLYSVPEVPWPPPPAWRGAADADLPALLQSIAAALAEAFDLELPGGTPWGEVLCHEEPRRLAELGLPDATLDELLPQVAAGRGYFLPDVPALFLAGASAGTVAEEVAHALHFELVPRRPREDPAEDFPARALREAVGFLGSRVLVPDRPHWDPEDPELEVPEGLLCMLIGCDPMDRAKAFLLDHPGEGPVLFDPDPDALRALHAESVEAYLAAAHAAGYLLGSGVPLSPREGRELFLLEPGEGLEGARATWRRAWELYTLG